MTDKPSIAEYGYDDIRDLPLDAKVYLDRIRIFIFQTPYNPHNSRASEVGRHDSVKVDEGWTARVRRGTTPLP